MRVVITDSDMQAGRRLAASVEELLPSADVLLYAEPGDALRGISDHRPDAVFVAPTVGPMSGPEVATEIGLLDVDVTVVGLVDEPGAEASRAWVAAGADVVAQRPVDRLALRAALRQRAGGIP